VRRACRSPRRRAPRHPRRTATLPPGGRSCCPRADLLRPLGAAPWVVRVTRGCCTGSTSATGGGRQQLPSSFVRVASSKARGSLNGDHVESVGRIVADLLAVPRTAEETAALLDTRLLTCTVLRRAPALLLVVRSERFANRGRHPLLSRECASAGEQGVQRASTLARPAFHGFAAPSAFLGRPGAR